MSITNDEINSRLQIVKSQTNYSEDESVRKLVEMNYDVNMVLRDYMGIKEKPKTIGVNKINNEIFRQFRKRLDSSMKEYREKHPIQIDNVISNFLKEKN